MTTEKHDQDADPFTSHWEEISNNILDYFKNYSSLDDSSDPTLPSFFEVLDRLWSLDRDPENPSLDEKNESWYHSFRNINASWNIQFSQPKVSGSAEDENWWKILQSLDDLRNRPFQRLEIRQPVINSQRFVWLRVRIRNFFHRLIHPYLQEITDYTNTVLSLQQEFNQAVVQLQHEIIFRLLIERQIVFNAEMVRLLNQILQNLLFSRQKRFNMVVKELLKHIPLTIDQNHAVLDGKIAELAQQQSDLVSLRNVFSRFLDSASSKPATNKDETSSSVSVPASEEKTEEDLFLSDLYLQFENTFRGAPNAIKELQKQYLYYFQEATKVVDIGCGRGEFLEALKEQGIQALGIDKNVIMVELCHSKGFDVRHDDAFSYLENCPDESIGGIFSAQFIEHFTHEKIIGFFRIAYRKLAPGAYMIIETPNPRSLIVSGNTFHRDVTHRQLYHPDTVKFVLEKIGFDPVIIQESSFLDEQQKIRPMPDMCPVAKFDPVFHDNVKHNLSWLSFYLCAPQDFAAIARKPVGDVTI